MNNKGLLLACVIGTIIIGALFRDDLTRWLLSESTNNAYVKSELTHYSTQVAGIIEDIRVSDNQQVTGGQVAIVIDNSEIDEKLKEANARVKARMERIKGLEKRFTLESANQEVLNSEVALAKLDLEDSHDEYDRVNVLSKKAFVDQHRIQRVERQVVKSEELLSQTKLKQATQVLRVEAMTHEIKEEKLSLEQLQAEVEILLLQKQKYQVVIESDGVFGNRKVSIGEYIEPGTRLFSVVSQSDIWIEANFKETQIKEMEVGQTVRIKIDAFPDVSYKGYIDSFMPATGAEFSLFPPDRASGNFTKIIQRVPVKIRFSASEKTLNIFRSGLSATVSLDMRRSD